MNPSIGRIVHYRVGGTDETPELRPATVVRVWGMTSINVQVLLDGTNDERSAYPGSPGWPMFTAEELHRGMSWKTSIALGDAVGQWRWPAR